MAMLDSLTADIQGITGGRPYVFVVRAFGERYDVYRQHVKPVVENETGLLCIDAEDIPGAGHDLLAKVHLLIERAELVVAEISNESPNVFYEAGYATAIGRPLILIIEEDYPVPANLRGRVLIQYTQTGLGLESLDRQLGYAVSAQVTSSVSSLRDMLLAESQLPAYIVSSPKYPGALSRIAGQVYDRRTFGDNLGIRGVLSAFGLMLGRIEGVELVSAQHSAPDLAGLPLNLYLIGSGKINPLTEEMLSRLQGDCDPAWAFGPDPDDEPVEDYTVLMTRGEERLYGVTERVPSDDGTVKVYVEDYGLVLRGPHPDHADRMVLIMAGAHSLGTGAACLAATHPPLIRELARRLQLDCQVNLDGESDSDKRKKTIWALVRGCVSEETGYLLDPDGVTVQEVGITA